MLVAEVVYNAALAMSKVSLLLQYRRIFRGKHTKAVCFWLLILVPTWCLVSIILDSFSCTPVAILSPGLGKRCLKSLLVWTLTPAISIVTDFAVVLVPIPATWALQLHMRLRMLLTVLFGFGLW